MSFGFTIFNNGLNAPNMLPKDILLSVAKPGRYINHELNSYHHDPEKAELKFCLGYPDIYEVGMSNLGFRTIYDVLNQEAGVLCERAFLPWVDLEEIMRAKEIALSSLESDIPLKEFDCLGISLHTELNYAGLLNMLSLGKIPLLREERRQDYPLVIIGGPCCFNPEPLADFADLFVIGEAEELILEIVRLLKRKKGLLRGSEEKEDLLSELSRLEGIYAPALYEVEYSDDGRIRHIRPRDKTLPARIRKRIIPDINNTHYPRKTTLPYVEIIHDRIGIEIMRGCPHRCRFCQARNIYYPKRERSLATIEGLARDNFRSSGYEEIALLSLSSLDHCQISEIFSTLTKNFGRQGVGISLSSLRVNPVLKELIRHFEGMRRSGFTFAPEAGSERLRRVINKNIDTDTLYRSIGEIFSAGWRGLKFYFMLGLPGEGEEDLDAILDMVLRILQIKKETSRGYGKIRLSFNHFIPKPHTTFQWLPMERDEELQQKENYLRARMRSRTIQYDFSNRQMARVEALLSRGDRRLGKVILNAWRKGARLDAWKEQFNFSFWQEAVREAGLNPDFYLYRARTLDELFPWDHIDTGIKKDDLVEDYRLFQETLELR